MDTFELEDNNPSVPFGASEENKALDREVLIS